MLNLNCVICAELFGGSDDVHVTTCGHMFHFLCLKQWLERSKTCPQCRHKCTERNIIRIYFNLANLDMSRVDVASLQEQLDNAKLQIQVKESEVIKCEEQVKNLNEVQRKCIKTITSLENKLKKNDIVILSYAEQIKMMKVDSDMLESLRKEVKQLKEQIGTMEKMESLLKCTTVDAEKLLKHESDVKKLAVLVMTIKRELRHCEAKKTDLRNMLKVVQCDLRKEIEQKKAFEERISVLESENYQLNEKIKDLESKALSSKSMHNNNLGISLMVGLNDQRHKSLVQEENRLSISPTVKDNIKKIEESNSPYLKIKSSSVGLSSLFKRNDLLPGTDVSAKTTTKFATLKISPNKNSSLAGSASSSSFGAVRKTTSDLSEKYSIFKKPRLAMTPGVTSSTPLTTNFVFNGFGGSEKLDPFAQRTEEEKNESNKPKTTSPNNGKTELATKAHSLHNRLRTGGLRNIKITK